MNDVFLETTRLHDGGYISFWFNVAKVPEKSNCGAGTAGCSGASKLG